VNVDLLGDAHLLMEPLGSVHLCARRVECEQHAGCKAEGKIQAVTESRFCTVQVVGHSLLHLHPFEYLLINLGPLMLALHGCCIVQTAVTGFLIQGLR
jgi:hypothetical protein